MDSVQERLKLKRAPTDIWSVREQLCLASSVLKSGDQNWMSVSRSLKPIADRDSIRPSDWFSQKSCAQQYAYLLENADIPKRKKRECGETTSESIVRRLTQDRICELSNILTSQRDEYLQLKNELSLLKHGTISDEKLQKMWLTIEQEDQDQKHKTQIEWLSKQQQSKEQQSPQILNVQSIQKKVNNSITESQEISEINNDEEDKQGKSGRSSLLTSLLKSPSPTTQIQTPTQAAGSPTIASLLCSSPKVPGPVVVQNTSTQLHQLVSNVVPSTVQERPSASAPTLSMLLEQPSANAQQTLQQLQNLPNLTSAKNLQSTVQAINSIQTRSSRSIQGNATQITQEQQLISNSDLSNAEIPQIISDPIDKVMSKDIQLDKDEINEIIGDIEELIKEEITGSPQVLESSLKTSAVMDNVSAQTSLITERLEPRNVDEPVSLSDSPSSEVSIEEIDSSTSNIAEIIGTSMTIESKTNLPLEKVVNNEKESLNDDINKNETGCKVTAESKLAMKPVKEIIILTNKEIHNEAEQSNSSKKDQLIIKEEKIEQNDNEIEEIIHDKINSCEKIDQITTKDDKISKIENNIVSNNSISKISSKKANEDCKQEEIVEEIIESIQLSNKSLKNDNTVKIANETENKTAEENALITKTGHPDASVESKSESSIYVSEIITEIVKEVEVLTESKTKEKIPETEVNKGTQSCNKIMKESITKKEIKSKEVIEKRTKDENPIVNKESNNDSIQNELIESHNDIVIKKEIIDEPVEHEEIKESEYFDSNNIAVEIKVEPKKEDYEDNEEECKSGKEDTIKKEIPETSKKGSLESTGSVDELDEEESTLSKLSGGRAMKTYSKKQNAAVDSEPENESSGETADYRAWKKSIMLVYNRLSTNRYASIFLRPITEDQAPGYHSIIFRPMDLSTIKKNIDNGTIRSTTHFQRDVMLMFQNAIMFNKHNTRIHKMTLEMQEECLQHMQVLVQAAGEASFRRETRTAASISNEMSDNSLKRKWTHITSSPHESESPRMKKRRKSEND